MKTSLLSFITLLSVFCLSTFLDTGNKARACNTTSTFQLTDCDSVVSPSGKHIWKVHGIYQDTIPNMAGCDSFMTITVRVNSFSATIQLQGTLLMAYPDSAQYIWQRCDSAGTLSTDQSFTPTSSGDYRVIVNFEGCWDTSECVYHIPGGVSDPINKSYNLYPNPASSYCMISSQIPVFVSIRSISGQLLATYEKKEEIRIDTHHFPPGTYLIQLESELGRYSEKLIIIHD